REAHLLLRRRIRLRSVLQLRVAERAVQGRGDRTRKGRARGGGEAGERGSMNAGPFPPPTKAPAPQAPPAGAARMSRSKPRSVPPPVPPFRSPQGGRARMRSNADFL